MDTVILIDEPIWPAHGTTWAHIVSDTSLDELHTFAETAGIPSRGFDHDHYDVPAARPVGVREFVERLNASGLRVPQKYKHSRH
jgi:hypothetical protein